MQPSTVEALFGLIGIVLGALITAYFLKRKNNAEAQKTEAETVQLYQNIADRAAEKALKLEDRITALERILEKKDQRIEELEKANESKDKQIISLQCQVDELQRKVNHLEEKKKLS